MDFLFLLGLAMTPRLMRPRLNETFLEEGPVGEDGLLLDDASMTDYRLIDDNGLDYYMVAD